jgi:hypothetical protein
MFDQQIPSVKIPESNEVIKSLSSIDTESPEQPFEKTIAPSQTNVYVYHNTFTAPNAQVGCVNGLVVDFKKH